MKSSNRNWTQQWLYKLVELSSLQVVSAHQSDIQKKLDKQDFYCCNELRFQLGSSAPHPLLFACCNTLPQWLKWLYIKLGCV